MLWGNPLGIKQPLLLGSCLFVIPLLPSSYYYHPPPVPIFPNPYNQMEIVWVGGARLSETRSFP